MAFLCRGTRTDEEIGLNRMNGRWQTRLGFDPIDLPRLIMAGRTRTGVDSLTQCKDIVIVASLPHEFSFLGSGVERAIVSWFRFGSLFRS